MARRAKDSWLHARVSQEEHDEAERYAEAINMAVADLVRVGVKEYIKNHPIKVMPMLEVFPGIPASTQSKSQE